MGKKRKMYEKQMVNMDNAILRLTEQKMALESSALQKTVVDTVAAGAKTMKTLNKQMDVDKVEDMRSEMEEAMDMQDEINDVMATPLAGMAMDEDDIEDELNELMLDSDDELDALGTGTTAVPAS